MRFISCFKAQKLIAKGCLYHLVQVKGVKAEKQAPILQSILVVNEYSDMFPDELPTLPLLERLILIFI